LDIYQETIRYDSQLLGARMLDIHKSGVPKMMRWHVHEEMELILVIQGGVDMDVDHTKYRLKPDDLLLIGPNELHRSMKHQDDVHYLVLQFDVKHHMDRSALAYLPCFFNPLKPMSAYNSHLFAQANLRHEFTEHMLLIQQELSQRPFGYEMAVSLHIGSMLFKLLRIDPSVQQPDRLSILERLQPALAYIDAHLEDKITTAEVCQQVNLSYEHTAHLFKQALGMSIIQFVNYKRIKKAEVLLAAVGMTVTGAAHAVGIENLAHFINLFKRWNQVTPRVFQQYSKQR
jgi:AraC-like DNA-binding protein